MTKKNSYITSIVVGLVSFVLALIDLEIQNGSKAEDMSAFGLFFLGLFIVSLTVAVYKAIK